MAVFGLVLGIGCSPSGTPPTAIGATGSTTRPIAAYTGYPDSIAAIGHSAITGEGTQPGQGEAKANSWATGTNPEVNSVYLRILRAHPAVEGHAVNLGTGGADLTSLAAQAQQLITEDPQPQLVLIATLDSDITCPATESDFKHYGEGISKVLEDLSAKMPGSRLFITTQISTPSRDAQIYSSRERASLGGTGACAFLDPNGNVVPEDLRRLEAAIAGFKAQLTAACAKTPRCSTDQSGRGWNMRRADYSDDLNHLNMSGQARWAEHVWGQLLEAQLLPKH